MIWPVQLHSRECRVLCLHLKRYVPVHPLECMCGDGAQAATCGDGTTQANETSLDAVERQRSSNATAQLVPSAVSAVSAVSAGSAGEEPSSEPAESGTRQFDALHASLLQQYSRPELESFGLMMAQFIPTPMLEAIMRARSDSGTGLPSCSLLCSSLTIPSQPGTCGAWTMPQRPPISFVLT